MKFKIDTKEKFTVVMPEEDHLYDNMAAELAAACNDCLTKTPSNVILNLQPVTEMQNEVAQTIASVQQQFYDKNASFVICSLQPGPEKTFEALDLLELLNITPTESEAWDIIQMEEIERELLDSDDIEFEANE